MTGLLSLLAITYINCSGFNAGSYNWNTNKIIICQNFEENNTILYHEVSHYVRFNLLTKQDRNDYRKLRYNSDYFVSSYAKNNNIEEDFAETMRIYIQTKKVGDKTKLAKRIYLSYYK